MTRRRLLLILIAAMLAAGGVVAWQFWPLPGYVGYQRIRLDMSESEVADELKRLPSSRPAHKGELAETR